MIGETTMWFFLLLQLFDLLGARAQTTNATCSNNSSTSWLFSPSGDSPCLTWSKLQSLCLPPDKVINVPPLLDASWGYNSPDQGASECQCNSVSYSLMAGCTFCQIGQSGNWADEGTFSAACQNYNSNGIGVGVDLQLPAYAWREWDGTRWDPAAASSSASSFTAFPTQTYSTTLSRAFTASTSSSPPSITTSISVLATGTLSHPTSTPSTASHSTSSHTGPIIGGIVGGIVALILLFFVIYRFCIRNRHSSSSSTNEKVFDLTPSDKVTTSTPATSYRSPSSPRSYLDILGSATSLIGVPKSEKRRQTELIADPRSFSSPRPAPTPTPTSPNATSTRVHGLVGGNRDTLNLKYTTTTERMRTRSGQYRPGNENDEDEDDGQEILRKLPPVDGGLVVYDSPEEDFDYERQEREGRENESEAKAKNGGKRNMKKNKSFKRDTRLTKRNSNISSIVTLGQLESQSHNNYNYNQHQSRQLYPLGNQRPTSYMTDFSRSRPLSTTPTSTIHMTTGTPRPRAMSTDTIGMADNRDTTLLPSLYEPQTGAARYSVTSQSRYSVAPSSPESKYAPTLSEAGAAYGNRNTYASQRGYGSRTQSGYTVRGVSQSGYGNQRPLSVGTVGAALGSGKRSRFVQRQSTVGVRRKDKDERERWEQEVLPPLPE